LPVGENGVDRVLGLLQPSHQIEVTIGRLSVAARIVDERRHREMHGCHAGRRLTPITEDLVGDGDVGQNAVPVAEPEVGAGPEVEAVQRVDGRTGHRVGEAAISEIQRLDGGLCVSSAQVERGQQDDDLVQVPRRRGERFQ